MKLPTLLFQASLLWSVASAAWTCPAAGSTSAPLPQGVPVDIHKTTADGQLCTITKLDSKNALVPVGRSYDRHNWEPAPGSYASRVSFHCGSTTCRVTLPRVGSSEKYVLTSYERKLGRKETISRFLEQATFGPTRGMIDEWHKNANLELFFASWMRDQMTNKKLLTTHREYWRKRTNARFNSEKKNVASIACKQNSRWYRYMFKREDWVQKRKVVLKRSTRSGWLVVYMDDKPLSEVQELWANNLKRIGLFHQLRLLRVTDELDSVVIVQKSNGTGPHIHLSNSAIFFHDVATASRGATVLNLPSSARLSVINRENSGESEYILDGDISLGACSSLPPDGSTVFSYQASTKRWLLYDPRHVFLQNIDKNPLPKSGGQVCASAPRTFLNEDTCRISEPHETSCGSSQRDVMVCGSPDEVKNEPKFGDEYDAVIETGDLGHWIMFPQRQSVWATIALYSKDQLRQRVAWALSQILTMAVGDVEGFSYTEPYVTFYDIFVRHAFGNYFDILKEVAYSPMMGEMLTYLKSRSSSYVLNVHGEDGVFPDENFAREVLQLFSVGLVNLNPDGTSIVDRDGKAIETYTNDDIMDGARAWTGFDRQVGRDNLELLKNAYINRVDPMKIVPEWRDPFPKMSVTGAYIGSGYPLCVDLPDKMFLHRGAEYRLLGSTPTPDLVSEPRSWASDGSIVRVALSKSSQLNQLLCNAGSDGKCRPATKVIINPPGSARTLRCDGKECNIDEPRVVQLAGQKLYYEYVRPACVHHAFYNGGRKIRQRNSVRSPSICADPCLPVAAAACCDRTTSIYATHSCEYSAERVRHGSQKCKTTCQTWQWMNGRACGNNNCCANREGYFWTDHGCKTQAKIDSDGKVALVHNHATSADDIKNNNLVLKSLRDENKNYFRVRWANERHPNGNCPSQCRRLSGSDVGSCICDVTVREERVFSTIPSAGQVLSSLSVGSINPATLGCSKKATRGNVVHWDCARSNAIDAKSVFEIVNRGKPSVYRRNVRSLVGVDGSSFAFENPPQHVSIVEQHVRDVRRETDDVLEQYFRHPNTAPFVAIRLIQRFGISNPSPRFVKVVSSAFSTGSYHSEGVNFGSGEYGDMASTVAAILLDRESRSTVLDADPSHGSLREPLLRVTHFMRALEFKPNLSRGASVRTENVSNKIGQMAHAIPTVFSFFLSDYVPAGRISSSFLVSPEAGVSNSPHVIGIMDGLMSLVKFGLSDCFGGLGPFTTPHCDAHMNERNAASGKYDFGRLHFKPTKAASKKVVRELSMLLTAGRMDKKAKDTIKSAMAGSADKDAQLRIALQLMASAPEFHSTNLVARVGQRPDPKKETLATSAPPYKAIVHMLMAGGMDSYNMVVPDEDTCPEVYNMYKRTRGSVSLSKSELSGTITTSGQPCTKFRLHNKMKTIKSLYDAGDALFIANMGPLNKPSTLDNWEENHKSAGLFAHNRHVDKVRRLDPFEEADGTGVLGRMTDALRSQGGYNTDAVSVENNGETLEGRRSPPVNYVSHQGVIPFNAKPSTPNMNSAIKGLNSATEYNSGLFGDKWSDLVIKGMSDNINFYEALKGVEPTNGPFGSAERTSRKLEVVSKLMKHPSRRAVNRDVFYVSLNGWDAHFETKLRTSAMIEIIDDALSSFVAELKAQGKWDDTTIVISSDFGRTLTANSGEGTDHGWGGNYFILGGNVKGGRMLGQYPDDFAKVDTGRGRVLPSTPWEAVWQGVASWFGVNKQNMDEVLPNRRNFSKKALFKRKQLYNK